MRIGIFTDTYPPYVSGVATSVYMLKKALEKNGHQVFLVTVNPEKYEYKYEENGKVIKIPGIPTGIYDYRLTSVYPIRVINKIKKWKLDVIHSHTEFGVGTFARIIAKQFNIPLVHTYHTQYEDYVHYITHGYFNKSSKKLVEYLSLFYCDSTATELIVPTKKTCDLFTEKYGLVDKNIYIVPTGIELERFYVENLKKENLEKAKKDLKIKKDDFVLLYLGRLGKEKNIEFLINCQKDIVKKHPNIRLIIIGGGPEQKDFEDLAKKNKLEDNILFTGMIPWEEVPNYYQYADLFVTASQTETQGLTVIEAMAAGIPPICMDDDSFRLAVVDGINGRLFKDKKEYKNIIEELYNDRDKIKRMSKQARANAELHSSKHYADSVVDVYKNAIKEKKGRFGLLSDIIERIKK